MLSPRGVGRRISPRTSHHSATAGPGLYWCECAASNKPARQIHYILFYLH